MLSLSTIKLNMLISNFMRTTTRK